LAYDIKKELDANDCSFGHLTLILSLPYLVKCRSHSLTIYNNEFILVNVRELFKTLFMAHIVVMLYVVLYVCSSRIWSRQVSCPACSNVI